MSPEKVLDTLDREEFKELAESIAAQHHVTVLEMLGSSRMQMFARARHNLWYAIRNHSERFLTLEKIASLMGVDHSSVAHGINAHTRRLVDRKKVAALAASAARRKHCGGADGLR